MSNTRTLPESVEVGGSVFGYTTATGPEVMYTELGGKGVPTLRRDTRIRVRGVASGYVSGEARVGDTGVIIGFRLPSKEVPGVTSSIVGVVVRGHVTWLKPNEIEIDPAGDA